MKAHELHGTGYFDHRLAKRGITRDEVNMAYENEIERVAQEDGRIRIYGRVPGRRLYMRIVLLEDGETLLNALYDENYTRKKNRE